MARSGLGHTRSRGLERTVPDYRSPSIIPLFAAVGGLIGAAIGRARGVDRDRMREIVENWAFFFGALAAVAYIASIVTGI